MSTIYQGDQYYIPFTVKQDGKVVTPADVDGLRAAVGGVIQTYPDGDLIFDEKTENWMFRLKAEDSQRMTGNVPCQFEFKKGADRQHGDVFYVNAKQSILKGEW